MARSGRRRRAVLITGGARRIGRALVLAFVGRGYAVALHCHRSRAAAARTAAAVRRSGGECEVFPCDLAGSDAAAGLVPAVRRVFPGLEVLVNNASVFEPGGWGPGSADDFDRHMAVNLRAPFLLTSAFAEEVRRGHVVNILDRHIVTDRVSHLSYLLSKKALWDLTRLSAVSLAPDIRVNGVAPGAILPPVGRSGSGWRRVKARGPLRRGGRVEDVTDAVFFLLENPAVTGEVVFVDGGEHLRGGCPRG